MWPWGHVAVGYLGYSALCRLRWRQAPAELAAIIAVFGTQFPDLVDKPLAWSFHVLPSGRSLAHSVFTTVFLCSVLYVVARHYHRSEYAVAFSLGYASHLVADSIYPILGGQYHTLDFLLWPALPTPYVDEQGFIAHFSSIDPASPTVVIGVVMVLLTVGVWVADGAPGWHLFRRLTRRLVSTRDRTSQ